MVHSRRLKYIPALDGLESRLRSGATVADVGCGHGASTILMAQAFPRSRFTGFDYHSPSIAHAQLYHRVEIASLTDDLTGLGNTRSFNAVLPAALALASL